MQSTSKATSGSTSRQARRGTLALLGITLALTLAPLGAASAQGTVQAQGTFATIDVPGAVSTTASGINASGQITGWYRLGSETRDHGFILSGGQFRTIDPPGSINTRAFGLNPRGDVVGFYRAADGSDHGFLLKRGVFTTMTCQMPRARPHSGSIPAARSWAPSKTKRANTRFF
jgi:hypothetical protein